MKVKDFSCYLHMPEMLDSIVDSNGVEKSHKLSPRAIQASLLVDEYPACPTSWMHGSSKVSSYFVEVEANKGMWLDFNDNFNYAYDVAIVLSIQGINPLTGQKLVGDNQLRLEKYDNKCPIHDIEFKSDRYCDKCGYKWPAQNYLHTTGFPHGRLWLDGFVTPEGNTRQYIFTEEEMRGVASQIIGEDKVYAIGVAFYKSKKDVKGKNFYREDKLFSKYNSQYLQTQCFRSCYIDASEHDDYYGANEPDFLIGCSIGENNFDEDILLESSESLESIEPVKKLEIGAGALINQKIYDDPRDIDYWEEEPSGMIYINYCDPETMRRIISGGKRVDKKDGFMQNIKVGN